MDYTFKREISLKDDNDYEPLKGIINNFGLIEVTYSDFSNLKKGEYVTITEIIGFLRDREITITMSLAY